MAANVKRERDDGTILVTNVGTDKTAGKLIVVGELVCMHKSDQVASATNCPVFVKDVEILYTKLTTDVAAAGAKLYYDDTNDYLTVTVGTDPVLKYAGICAAAAGSTDTTCRCHLGLKR